MRRISFLEYAPSEIGHIRPDDVPQFLAKKTAILENPVLSVTMKNCLAAVALMRSMVSPEAEYKISNHGSVIFTLPDGGKVCDTGKAITFTDNAREKAVAYMCAKWDVRRQTLKKATGELVFTLATGQRVSLAKDARAVVRPVIQPQRRRQQQKSMER